MRSRRLNLRYHGASQSTLFRNHRRRWRTAADDGASDHIGGMLQPPAFAAVRGVWRDPVGGAVSQAGNAVGCVQRIWRRARSDHGTVFAIAIVGGKPDGVHVGGLRRGPHVVSDAAACFGTDHAAVRFRNVNINVDGSNNDGRNDHGSGDREELTSQANVADN